jgi:uncharacterized protein (DUF433 family)
MQRTIRKPDVLEPDEADTELVPRSDPRAEIISIDPGRVSGTPCFVGTRVPIKNLWDYLEGGDSLDEFLDGFPGVSREQAIKTLHMAFERLLDGLPEGTPRR